MILDFEHTLDSSAKPVKIQLISYSVSNSLDLGGT